MRLNVCDLKVEIPLFTTILHAVKDKLNFLSPASAMAGIYTMMDNHRGVWKAPANVSLNSVISPTVNISHNDQQDLNAPLQGKSINAIRTFIGKDSLVWGARTLDGNSNDWRYISVLTRPAEFIVISYTQKMQSSES